MSDNGKFCCSNWLEASRHHPSCQRTYRSRAALTCKQDTLVRRAHQMLNAALYRRTRVCVSRYMFRGLGKLHYELQSVCLSLNVFDASGPHCLPVTQQRLCLESPNLARAWTSSEIKKVERQGHKDSLFSFMCGRKS